jgi:hypothetical protein
MKKALALTLLLLLGLAVPAHAWLLELTNQSYRSGRGQVFFIPASGSEAGLTNGGDPTITFALAPSIGDMVLVCGGFPDTADGAAILTGSYTTIHDGDLTTNAAFICAYKFLTTAETTVQGEGGGAAADAVAYVSMTFRGVDKTTPMDVTAVTSFSVAAAVPTCSTITPVTPGAKVVCACGIVLNDATVTAPTGYQNVQDASGGNDTDDFSTYMSWLPQAVPAATGSAAYSAHASNQPYVCVHIALRPAP